VEKILFRGKRTDTGEWATGFYIENALQANSLIAKTAIAPEGCYPIEIDAKTLGQYRSDIKAFDGDWIKAKTSKTPEENIEGFLTFQDMECVIEQNCGHFPICSFAVIDRLTVEVTGENIYDNPSLLTKK
jgi:hypothetical protein